MEKKRRKKKGQCFHCSTLNLQWLTKFVKNLYPLFGWPSSYTPMIVHGVFNCGRSGNKKYTLSLLTLCRRLLCFFQKTYWLTNSNITQVHHIRRALYRLPPNSKFQTLNSKLRTINTGMCDMYDAKRGRESEA